MGGGVFAAAFRFGYSFLLLYAYVVDVAVFGALGGLVAYFRPKGWWLWSALMATPSLVVVMLVLLNLGTENLARGIGVGWAYSAILIPISALAGAWIGSSRAARVSPSRERRAQ
jgi:hypothetical protein